jgi:dolichyl-phosphate-mannose-protein mannosyltransferase
MGLVILAATAAVYLAGWVLHFTLLTEAGSGDAWGIPEWNEPIVASFWRELVDLHRTMYNANNGLTTPHHDSSPWWGWPFMSNPVFYWQGGVAPLVAAIYFIGNPVVWIGSTIILLATLVWILIMIGKEGDVTSLTKTGLLIPLLGYGLAFYPLTRVDRGLFLYHYLTPLVFAIVVGVLWLDQRGWFNRTTVRQQPPRVYIAGAVVLLFFLLFSPLTYGVLLSPETQQLLFWFSTWR